MTAETLAAPTDTFTEGLDALDIGLPQLISRGFRFIHSTDDTGDVVAVIGVRVHHNVVDVLQLNEDVVSATRMTAEEPDVLAPRSWLWRSIGAVQDVLHDLLRLPDDRTPGVLTQPVTEVARGCWVPTRPGRFQWLAAQA